MASAHVAKYLARYAEAAARSVADSVVALDGTIWHHAVAIPLRDEGKSFWATLFALKRAATARGERALAILILNNTTATARDAQAWHNFVTRGHAIEVAGGVPARRLSLGSHLDAIALAFLTPPFAFGEKEGVGHARKLGVDLALALWHRHRVRSPWFSTTDGDAAPAADYFAPLTGAEKTFGLGGPVGAFVHPYRHRVRPGRARDEALALYEIYLRHYRAGLESARSPYAFPTIGSLITVHAEAYATVRGFPKRDAAEDFYLLDKIAKSFRIALGGGAVDLRARASARVPFGTGQAMAKIERELANHEVFTLPPPASFRALAEQLRRAERALIDDKLDPNLEIDLDPTVRTIVTAARSARKTPADRLRHFHTAFDGLRTYQFLKRVEPETVWHAALDDRTTDPFVALAAQRKRDATH